MKKQACGKKEDDEVVVRIVNPAAANRALVARSTQFSKRVDVLLSVGSNDTGRPVLLIGCQLEGEWVTLDLLKGHAANWWDRLHTQKRRTLPPPQQKTTPLCQILASHQSYYSSNLAKSRRPRDLQPAPVLTAVFNPVEARRSLYKLPGQRWRARAEIHKKYSRVWKNSPEGRAEAEQKEGLLGETTLDDLQLISELLNEST